MIRHTQDLHMTSTGLTYNIHRTYIRHAQDLHKTCTGLTYDIHRTYI